MGRIVIEEVDKTVMSGLMRRAEQNSVSLEQEVKSLLTQSVARPGRQDIVARAEAIAAMTPQTVPQTDSVLLLREDRARGTSSTLPSW